MNNKSKRNLLISSSVFVLFLGAFGLTARAFNKFENVNLFAEGLQTCFYRVTQTYTALLWNAKTSPYRTDNFLKTTEECFGDLLEEARSLEWQNEAADFNEMASLAHWFHLGVADAGVPMDNVQSKYENIEVKRDQIQEQLDSIIANLRSDSKIYLHLMASFSLLIFGIAIFFANSNREEDGFARIEEKARLELDRADFPMASRIENILISALEAANLKECRELFFNYHTEILEGKVAPIVKRQRENGPEEETLAQVPLEPFCLNDEFEAVLDQHNQMLIANNIFYMDDFSSEITLYGEKKIFSTMVSELIQEGVKSIPQKAEKKLINVSSKKLGGTINLNMEFLCEQSEINYAGVNRLRESLKEKDSEFSAITHQLNILTISKGLACKGVNIQLVFPIPIEKQETSAKKTTVRKFRKKDFNPSNNISPS